MTRLLIPFLAVSLLYPQSENATLTLYKDGYGLVKQSIIFDVDAGRNSIRYSSLPNSMEPQSPFLSLPEAEVIYQKYSPNVFDTFNFLKDHLGTKVKVKPLWGRAFKGRLVNVDRNWVTVSKWWSTKVVNLDEVVTISIAGQKIAPTAGSELLWEVVSKKRGEIDGELIYMSGGFDWDADYRLVVLPDELSGRLSSQAIIKNQTDLTFLEARLELVEGELKRLPRRGTPTPQLERAREVQEAAVREAVVFNREALGDYYFYSLSEPLTIPKRESITVSLYPERQIAFSRLYLFENYERSTREEPLTVQISFLNSESNNLGIPLPSGSFKIYYSTSEGMVKFAGEDFLHQVALSEEAQVVAGRAFDVLGKRTVVNYDRKKKSEEVAIRLEISNKRKDTVTAQLTEHIHGDWVIRDPSHEYRKTDAQTVQFNLTLRPGSTERVTYTYRKEWQ